MRNLREQFSSGLFSLSGSSTNRDVADLYKFLKGDYYVWEPWRCKLVSHLGHQENNHWYISEKGKERLQVKRINYKDSAGKRS